VDYFQGVVAEYLRANRATFVNPEFFLQLDNGLKSPPKGTAWYVDLLAINLAERTAYLCEVTYSESLAALLERLAAWSANWSGMMTALRRDACVADDWQVRPWLFVPEHAIARLIMRLPALPVVPKVTPLEMTQPWRFSGWDRQGEAEKPGSIPVEMR